VDYRLFFSTFVAVFLAELGDKTQLATMSFASSGSSKWTVFCASSAALVASTALAVLAGALVTKWISPLWIKRASGALFLVLGTLLLLTKSDAAPAATEAKKETEAAQQ
jgi:Ca2+/H+ antiporter, TMEM165/GDT1 family